MKRKFSIVATTAVVMIALATMSVANITNVVPSYFSFEDDPAGSSVVGANGWYAADTNAGIIVAETYPPPAAGFPIATNHTQILEISDTITNKVSSSGEKVFVDTMISPRQWDQEDHPTVPADAQLAAYVDTNDNVVIWHKNYSMSGPERTNKWSVLQNAMISTGEWVRLTFEMNYVDQDLPAGGLRFFRVILNGVEVSDDDGRSQPTLGSTAGGPWFPMADNTRNFISSLTVNGTGKIDDLQFVTNDPNTTVFWSITATVDDTDAASLIPNGVVNVAESNDQVFTWFAQSGYSVTNVAVDGVLINPTTNTYTFSTVVTNHTIHVLTGVVQGEDENGVPYSWLSSYGLEESNSDVEPDGMFTWQEYAAGTDPIDENSVFQVLGQGHGSPSNYVVYYCTTNNGVTDPVDIYRSTDLTDTNGWVLVGDNVPRAADGTNVWWDTNPPSNMPAFYRPTILWVTQE